MPPAVAARRSTQVTDFRSGSMTAYKRYVPTTAFRSVLRKGQQLEWPILIMVLLVAGAAWAFAELADEVMKGDSSGFDQAVLLALRSPTDPAVPLGPRWLQETMRDFTALGGMAVLTMITIAAAGYLVLTGKSRAALDVCVAIGTGILLSNLLKYGFDRPRPDLVPQGSYVYTTSFPSGHSMMSAVVYLTLGALIARVESGIRIKTYVLSVAVFLTVLIGVSRVYLGVHWPTDVLAGWVVGAAWALVWWAITLWLQKRGQVESDYGQTDQCRRPGDPLSDTKPTFDGACCSTRSAPKASLRVLDLGADSGDYEGCAAAPVARQIRISLACPTVNALGRVHHVAFDRSQRTGASGFHRHRIGDPRPERRNARQCLLPELVQRRRPAKVATCGCAAAFVLVGGG
jgi:undecaprenyl-diphosphatase